MGQLGRRLVISEDPARLARAMEQERELDPMARAEPPVPSG
jgi:hypothetical protein